MLCTRSINLLLVAVVLHASCQDRQCEEAADTAWLQLRVSNDSHSSTTSTSSASPTLPEGLQALADCSPDDMACMARRTACSLVTKMQADWPLSFSEISDVWNQLQDVCTGHPLSLEESMSATSFVETNASDDECGAAGACIPNVVDYESKNKGAKYGMKTGKAVAKAAVDTLKEVLKAGKYIALHGTIAFAFIGAFISAFFPSAGGLPENPRTYATKDWGKCVWEQVKPFVQEFVSEQLEEAFEDLWQATLDGFQTRLWALNATAYQNSEKYENGTVKEMSNKTRDRMYDDLMGVHNAMLGSVKLFMVDRAINTTAGAYLSQFASLHVSVMTNLMGSLAYRTQGDRYVFQTAMGCYAQRVYERATLAYSSRMSALSANEQDHGTQKCCKMYSTCIDCPILTGEFKDTWRNCNWKDSGYSTICVGIVGRCMTQPSPFSLWTSKMCYNNHRNEVQKQLVKFWSDWLAPIPIWLNNVVLMQEIEVQKAAGLASADFDCSAF